MRTASSGRWTVAVLVALGSGLAAHGASATPKVALTLPRNIAPTPNFDSWGSAVSMKGKVTYTNPCVRGAAREPSFSNVAACTHFVLRAIDRARASEGVAPMVLPSNWYSLSAAEQLFVIADLERVDRGLPAYLGINAALTANAQSAALSNQDPGLAAGFAVGQDAQGSTGLGATWASAMSPLAADYMWMYNDGWGGPYPKTLNVDCTSATASGCWGHREELLGYDPGFNPGVGLGCTTCEMGTGFASVKGTGSYTDLVELPAGAPPAMTFTWAKDVKPFLGVTSPVGPTAVRTLASYLVGDPLTNGTAVPSDVLATYADQVQTQLDPLLARHEQDKVAYNAWSTTDASSNLDLALVGLVAFTGTVPKGLANELVTQACTTLGGVASSSTASPGLTRSLEATCTDATGGAVTVVTWAKGNVQGIVVVDGADIAPTVAESAAVAQAALLPTAGIVITTTASWRINAAATKLSAAQERLIAAIAQSVAARKPTTLTFSATVRSATIAAKSQAKAVVIAVATYLSARLAKDGMSASARSALSIGQPVITAFPHAGTPTSVVVTIHYVR